MESRKGGGEEERRCVREVRAVGEMPTTWGGVVSRKVWSLDLQHTHEEAER